LRPVEDSDEDTAGRCGQLRGSSRVMVRHAGKGCPAGDFICMDAIEVGAVAEAAERLLVGSGAPRELVAVR
jgi:hypothetical protein